MQEKIQEKTESLKDIKLQYEKPQFAKVRLFADQVLIDCDPNMGDGNKLSG